LISELALLAADKTIETGICTLFDRYQSLGCRGFTFKSFVHVARDPGCYRRAAEFLSPLAGDYERAIVIFDLEGSGASISRERVEQVVEERLATTGWSGRSACIVADPEIENWVWTDSPHVATSLGWSRAPDLRTWLKDNDWWPEGTTKPARPKEALQAVLRVTGEPRSSSLYGAIASKVSLTRCTDPAFLKFRDTLRQWFPAT